MLALSELYFFQNDLNFGKFYVFHLPCIFKILHFSENESQVSTLCRSLSLDAPDVEGKFRLISALLSKYAIVSGFREIYSWKKKGNLPFLVIVAVFFVCLFVLLDPWMARSYEFMVACPSISTSVNNFSGNLLIRFFWNSAQQ